jgi:hypothetical protein
MDNLYSAELDEEALVLEPVEGQREPARTYPFGTGGIQQHQQSRSFVLFGIKDSFFYN